MVSALDSRRLYHQAVGPSERTERLNDPENPGIRVATPSPGYRKTLFLAPGHLRWHLFERAAWPLWSPGCGKSPSPCGGLRCFRGSPRSAEILLRSEGTGPGSAQRYHRRESSLDEGASEALAEDHSATLLGPYSAPRAFLVSAPTETDGCQAIARPFSTSHGHPYPGRPKTLPGSAGSLGGALWPTD